MDQMVRSYGLRQTLAREAPFGLAALVIAELFYKFHSFLLECVAFLATWYVLSLIGHAAWRLFAGSVRPSSQTESRR